MTHLCIQAGCSQWVDDGINYCYDHLKAEMQRRLSRGAHPR